MISFIFWTILIVFIFFILVILFGEKQEDPKLVKKRKLEEERKIKFEKERERKLAEESHRYKLEQYNIFITDLRNSVIIFDSNIYMEHEYESIFNFFVDENIKILMTQHQFDEIVNLKKDYDNSKRAKARQALRVIDFLTKTHILKIGFTSVDLKINSYAYADPEIFNFCLEISSKYKVYLITNDKILSIKTMQLANRSNQSRSLQSYNGNEFMSLLRSKIPPKLENQ